MKLTQHYRLIWLFMLFYTTNIFAQFEGYQNMYIDDFRYGLFVPPDYNPDTAHHLLLYLHGHTDTTSWEFPWYDTLFQEEYPTIVVTPKCPANHTDGWGDSWSMTESWAMGMTFRALDSVFKNYNIDTTRMHIGGTSMGSFGTFYVLASRPGMFASAWATCGGGDPATAGLLKDTPLWIFHGSADPTVPVEYSRDMYSALLDSGGGMVRYTEYPGVGHNSWDNVGQESTLDPWLFAQQLGSVHGYPDSVEDFSAIPSENNQPELLWEAPEDQSGEDKYIWAYRIYRDDSLLATVNNDIMTFTDAHADNETLYHYSVVAMNYFFHEASPSEQLAVTTGPSLIEENSLTEYTNLKVYPNPVSESARIDVEMTGKAFMNLSVFNILGQQITTIYDGKITADNFTFYWDTQNVTGGIYLLVLRSTGSVETGYVVVEH